MLGSVGIMLQHILQFVVVTIAMPIRVDSKQAY